MNLENGDESSWTLKGARDVEGQSMANEKGEVIRERGRVIRKDAVDEVVARASLGVSGCCGCGVEESLMGSEGEDVVFWDWGWSLVS